MDSVASFLALVLILAVAVRFNGRRSRMRLPPGPRGLPLIGNALDMPSSHPWETFSEWGKKWGKYHTCPACALMPTAKSRRGYDTHNAIWTTLCGREFARYRY